MPVSVKFEIFKVDPNRILDHQAALTDATTALDTHMNKLMVDARSYPPPSPSYMRTNVLFQGWSKATSVVGDAIVSIIANEAFDKYGRMYSGWVYGDINGLGQRALHAGHGWMNLFREHMARQQQLVDALGSAFRKHVK